MILNKKLLGMTCAISCLFLTANATDLKERENQFTKLTFEQREKLQNDAIEKIKATANDPISIDIIKEKAYEIAKYIEEEGKKKPIQEVLDSLRGGKTVYSGTYTWVHFIPEQLEKDSFNIVNPPSAKLEMHRLNEMKDVTGDQFFHKMNIIVHEKGEGWISYKWIDHSKPNKDLITKVSFLKGTKCGNVNLVVGSGTSDPKVVEELTKLNLLNK